MSCAQGSSKGPSASQSLHLCTLFGMNFFVHGKAPDLSNGDLCVAAWAVKPVQKQADCFFQQQKVTRKFAVLLPDAKEPRDLDSLMSLRLVPETHDTSTSHLSELMEATVSEGGTACFLPLIR